MTNTAAKLQWGEIKQQDRIHYNPTLQKQSHLLISMGGKTGRHENTEHIVGVLFHIYFHAVLKKKRKSSQSKQKNLILRTLFTLCVEQLPKINKHNTKKKKEMETSYSKLSRTALFQKNMM